MLFRSSVKTISTHKTHVLEKMGMTAISEMVLYAVAHQLIENFEP